MKMTVARWRARIQRALELKKVRDEESARFARAYAGDYNPKPKKDLDGAKDDASVNFIFAFIETVRPTLLPGTPRAFAEADEQAAEPIVPSAQGLLDKQMKEIGVKAELRQIIEDWFYGMAAALTDWDFSEMPVFKPGSNEPEIDEDSITDENPEGEQKMAVVRDRPILERLDPKDVIFDSDAKTRKKDKWRGHRIIYTFDEFKALPGLNPRVRKKVRPRTIPKDLQRGGDEGENYSTERNYVICWAIYDHENYCYKLIVDNDNIDEFALDLPWEWDIEIQGDPFPISILEAKRDPSNPNTFSQFKAYWGSIQERNVLRSIAKSTVRRNAPGWFAKKGAMDEAQKEKFTGSKIGEYCEANDPTGITIKPQFVLSPDYLPYNEQVSDDVIEVSGLIEYRADQSAGTATEASIQNQKASIRKGEAKTDFNDFCGMLYGKVFKLDQQFLDEAQAVRLRTPMGPQEYKWLELTKNELKGRLNITVKPGIEDHDDEALRRQQDLKMIELLAANPHVDPRKLAKIGAKAWGREPDEILKTMEQVQQEQAAMAAAEGAKSAPKKEDPKPTLQFSDIKVETLHPSVQAMVIAAAIKQNGVPQILGMGAGGGAPGGSDPANPMAPGAPSIAAPPPENSVMPGAELNQAPAPMPGAEPPPATPVQPASEMQGGPT